MSYLSFSSNYFDKAVGTVQGTFTRGIRKIRFKNFVEGIARSEKELRKDC